MIVHILWHGIALCGIQGPPCDWPADHVWVGLPDVGEEAKQVEQTAAWCPTCKACFDKQHDPALHPVTS